MILKVIRFGFKTANGIIAEGCNRVLMKIYHIYVSPYLNLYKVG